MAHLRTQIFDAVKARLVAIPRFSDPDKVVRGRKGAIKQEALPALTLTWSDSNEIADLRPFSGPNGEDGYDRRLPLSIVVHLRDDDPELEFDDICVEVESAMGAAIKLDGLVIEALLENERHYVNSQTGTSLCAGSINYRIAYKTLAADPQQTAL
ncbi:hypothetical protein [Sinorhizobium sp. NFACC03]|uniref:hypothetical protein n=1 Tax=Sinorhizobium sp. NFACC03 TaxID=1566295 RepID=UPI00088D7BE6|nr:hypothetical protein [Sinorhizobium sp. NFACC03]SDA39408.1 hypothetical protein SAMN03159448_00184 [Sinorhizobium sp. NFACC03]